MKIVKALMLLLFVYSAGITVVYATGNANNYGSENQYVTQLNNQIIQLNTRIEQLQKENDDIKAIRAMMEEEKVAKEAGQKRHEESLNITKPMFQGFENFELVPLGKGDVEKAKKENERLKEETNKKR